MYTFICSQCKKYFTRDRKTAKYCSYECSGISKKLSNINCSYCKKSFKPNLTRSKYCSQSCSGKGVCHQKGPNSPIWKGGIHRRKLGSKRNQPSGYIEIWNGDRWVGEHRQIVEKHFGIKLKKSDHVHHINGKKNDNRIENLVVLTVSQHNHHHKKEQVNNFKRDCTGRFIKSH